MHFVRMPPVRKVDFQNMTDSEYCSSSEEELHSACNINQYKHQSIGNGSGGSRRQQSYMNGSSTSTATAAAAVVSAPHLSDAVAHHQHILQLEQQSATNASRIRSTDGDVDLMMMMANSNFTHTAAASSTERQQYATNTQRQNQKQQQRNGQRPTSPPPPAQSPNNNQHHHHHQLHRLASTTGSSMDGVDTASVTILGRSSSSHKLLASPSDSGHSGSPLQRHQRPPMGPIRRCLFVASLALCVLTVVVFVWVIPCTDAEGGRGTCPARMERARTQNWVRRYEGLELKGAINVVRGVRGRSNNLVFMYRGERLLDSTSNFESPLLPAHRRNGIIALVGSTGAVSWYDEIGNEPTVIDCGLIDADRNGVWDCLVLDDVGELGCIDPVSGQWLWRIHDRRTMSSARLLSFPLVLPDLNDDGVAELLVTTTTTPTTMSNVNSTTPTFNALIIVSGATGGTLGSRYVLRDCMFVHKFQLDARAIKVTFNCIKANGTELQIIESLETLVQRLLTNRTSSSSHPTAFEARRATQSKGQQQQQPKIRSPPIAQHKFFGQRRDRLTQRNIYAVAGKQLIVENTGKCPESCNVTVQLIEHDANGKEHVIRNFSGSRMYGMVPALLSFNASNTGSSGRKQTVHGFVIKFWQWAENETDVQMQFGGNSNSNGETTMENDEPRSKRDATVKNDAAADEFNRFAHVMPPESPHWRYPEVYNPLPVRLRRSTSAQNGSRSAENSTAQNWSSTVASSQFSSSPLPPILSPSSPSSLHQQKQPRINIDGVIRSKMRVIRERVVLIVFNSTDTRIENTSQSNIVQFCRRDEDVVAVAATGSSPAVNAAVSCQPDLNYQENSVLIADLDEDGSQELVTYYTTYVNAASDAEAKMEWKLVNYVQLLRLEAELPKLYVVDETSSGRV